MDFGTMSQKLAQGDYVYMEEFAKDVELVFSNCRKFNPARTYPVTCADVVEKAFKKEWAKATEKKLTFAEKRSLQGLMTTLVKEDVSVSPFLGQVFRITQCLFSLDLGSFESPWTHSSCRFQTTSTLFLVRMPET